MGELDDLATALSAVEDWLREQPARHADDMAHAVHLAWAIVDDLADQEAIREAADDRSG